MKVEQYEGDQERRILIGMIVDPIVLSRITPQWGKAKFHNEYANLVGKWCIDFQNKYNKPPGKDITTLFSQWASKSKDKNTTSLVNKLLSGISDQYETLEAESTSQYVIDLANKYFNKVRLKNKQEAIRDALDNGELDKAQTLENDRTVIDLKTEAGIDVLSAESIIKTAFEEKKESLIEYPGAMGTFLGRSLERDGFIALVGPSKRGKSRCLLDIAWRGMLQRRKVALFQVGDMSQNQVMLRLMSRSAQQPLFPPKGQSWPCTINWPIGLEKPEGEKWAEVLTEPRTFTEALSWQVAVKANDKIKKKKLKSKLPFLKLVCYPNGSVSVASLTNALQTWETLGWKADCVIIDYADLLAPIDRKWDKRDQINETWASMRALSQSMHNLVITATQAPSRAYGAELLDMSHFSDDRRKNDHVTGMIGICQTLEEKGKGVTRFCWATPPRDQDAGPAVHVAGLAEISHPIMYSIF